MRREDPKFIEKRKKFYAEQKQKSQDKFSKGGLSPKQKVIAAKAPPPDKITGEDFAVMKKEKVMKARKGMALDKFAKKKGLPIPLKKTFGKTIGVFPAIKTAPGSMASKAEAMKKTNGAGMNKLGKVATGKAGRIGALLTAGVVGLNMAGRKLKKVLDERKARKRDTAKVKKMGGGMMQKPMGYDDGGRVKNTRGISAIRPRGPSGRAASGPRKMDDILKDSKFKKYNISGSDLTIVLKDVDKVKKMGGGMMQKPMGYKSGKSIKVACKLGRNKPTKMY